MNKRLLFLLFLGLSCVYFLLQSCPLCIGSVTKDSPPFFSDEFYPENQNTDLHVDLVMTKTQ